MRIAVTGAYGFSGKYIARRLLDQRHEVITLTNSPHRANPFGESIKAFPYAPGRSELLTAGQSCPPAVPASSCFGVSFFGSMNGFSTITAEVRSRGVSTSSSVPSSECSVGTMA